MIKFIQLLSRIGVKTTTKTTTKTSDDFKPHQFVDNYYIVKDLSKIIENCNPKQLELIEHMLSESARDLGMLEKNINGENFEAY